MKKLTRKFLLLGAMVTLLGVFAFTGTGSSGAAPCCSTCEEMDFYCDTLPPGAEQNACFRRLANCYRWCTFSC